MRWPRSRPASAQAKQAQAEADQARFVAERKQEEAAAVRQRADELDPDVELDDAESDGREREDALRPRPADREVLDLRDGSEAQASSTRSRRSSDQ